MHLMMTVCSVCITILDVVYTKLYPVQVSLIIFNHVAPKKIKPSYHDKDNQSSTIITCRKENRNCMNDGSSTSIFKIHYSTQYKLTHRSPGIDGH